MNKKPRYAVMPGFVDQQRKPGVCSELACEQARGWTSPTGASGQGHFPSTWTFR